MLLSMKYSLNCILAFVICLNCLAQDSLKNKFPFSDTTLFQVQLEPNLIHSNLIAVANYENAIIYISQDSVLAFLNRTISELFYDSVLASRYKQLLFEIENSLRISGRDLTQFQSSLFKEIVSDQIIIGKAAIFDKKSKSYIKEVWHRIERVISSGYQKFYFSKSDRRYLFSYTEWTGLIPNEFMPDNE